MVHYYQTQRFLGFLDHLPVKHLGRLLGVEDEAGVVPPQHGHDAQTQAGGVAAHQAGRLEQQLGLHQAQLVQQLQDSTRSVLSSHCDLFVSLNSLVELLLPE